MPSSVEGAALRGGIQGGNQPVTGAFVYLYAASGSGYGAAATSLLCGTHTTLTCASPDANVLADGNGNGYVVTDDNGGFDLTGGYTCPGGAQVYVLALGGNPGLASTVNNGGLALMSALGSCSTLVTNAATTFISVNEVTTVASAYALAPFMTSPVNVGTSATNTLGLTNAFGTVYNLVNPSTGISPGVGQPVAGGAPAGLPANLVIPSSEINTLANILSYCVNSDPATSTNCSTLFADTTVGSTVPANTVQVALNIAKNPGLFNTTTLFGLEAPEAAFSPVLAGAPQDFTVGILYNGGATTPVKSNNGYSVAVDASGNVYATDNSAAYLTKITPLGVTTAIGNGITTPNVALNGSWGLAVDLSGNLWVTNSTSGKEALTELDSSGNLLAQATPTSSGGTTNGGMAVGSNPGYVAIDGNNNVWFTNFTTTLAGSVSKFNNSAVAISPAGGYVQTLTSKSDKPLGIAIDSSSNAWIAIQKGAHAGQVFAFSASDGSALAGTPYLTVSTPVNNTYGIAFDGNGNIWIPSRNTPSLVGITASGGALVASEPAAGFTGGGMAGATGLNAVAVDGDNNVWVGNDVGGNVSELVTVGTNANTFASPVGTGTAPTGGFQKGATTGTRGIAVDQAGNVWVSGNTSIVQIVGAAAPTVAPMALAVKNNKFGQRP